MLQAGKDPCVEQLCVCAGSVLLGPPVASLISMQLWRKLSGENKSMKVCLSGRRGFSHWCWKLFCAVFRYWGSQLVFLRLFPRTIPSPFLIRSDLFFLLCSKGRCFGSNTKSNLALAIHSVQLAPEEALETKVRVFHSISQ